MSPAEFLIILLAGVAAGTINTVVGSGSLITFPTLLALGYPPLLANVSNNVGLVPGGVSGVYGYRRELEGQRARLQRLLPASILGSLSGAALLLVLPSSLFDKVVIVLICVALGLVAVQPKLSRLLAVRRARGVDGHHDVTLGLQVLVALAGVYGGYFGAAQGIILISILGIMIDDHLQRLNAGKNVLTSTVNGVAAIVYILVTDVDWMIVAAIAVGSVIGGQIGARYGRRLNPIALRAVIVVVGIVAVARLTVLR